MEAFALPLPAWRQRPRPKKRKRDADAAVDHETSPNEDQEAPSSSSQLPSDSINPRSHSPNTLRQFAVAGLAPEEEVPSRIWPNFPHKPLPPRWQTGGVRSRRSRSRSRTSGGGSGSETDGGYDTDTAGPSRPLRKSEEEDPVRSSGRFKHMNTMMTILHRCLHDGDIPRAKRAFSLLIRTKDVDIRLNEMWTLGTEILMRDGDTKDGNGKGKKHLSKMQDHHDASGDMEDDEDDEETTTPRPELPRWGSASNMEKVRNYLELLSQHHPYDKNFPHSVTAVDFWPALYSIEIYNIDAECKQALHTLDESPQSADDDNDVEDQEFEPLGFQDEPEDYEARLQRKEDRRMAKHWAARNEIRRETQAAAQQIAQRMDNLMHAAPYTTHIELLRLRGMLSLFIGDLHLPMQLLQRGGFTSKNGIGDKLQRLSLSGHVRKQTQSKEEREAVWRRDVEFEKAKVFFDRMAEKGVQLEPWLSRLLDPDEDDASVTS